MVQLDGIELSFITLNVTRLFQAFDAFRARCWAQVYRLGGFYVNGVSVPLECGANSTINAIHGGAQIKIRRMGLLRRKH